MRTSEEMRKELTGDDKPEIEKNDTKAMMISGLMVIGVPCLLLILLIVGVTVLLFAR